MILGQTQVASLFTTPVLTQLWPGAAEANLGLREAILRRREQDAGVSLSNVLGWQSDDRMLDWGGAPARALHDHIVSECERITHDVKQSDARRFRWITNMWANLSQSGASNQTHSHPGAYWSAVYYVDDGYDGATDDALGGELVFLDPRMPMIRAATPDLRYRRPNGECDHQENWLRPQTGRTVIFPSWLMHSVRPYHGAQQRISIAINLTPRPIFRQRSEQRA